MVTALREKITRDEGRKMKVVECKVSSEGGKMRVVESEESDEGKRMRLVECKESVEGRKILKCNARRLMRKDK